MEMASDIYIVNRHLQEEYEAEDEVGRLECGHAYHLHCIKQWLAQKNACPVCKAEASSK